MKKTGSQDLRKRAESLAAERPAEATSLQGDRLVHELQVHQIELELQNEQLVHTCNELSVLRDRYVDLYDFAPVAYFTVDGDGRLVELNLAGAALVGQPREALAARRLVDFVHPESVQAFGEFVAQTLAGAEQTEVSLVLEPQPGRLVYVRAQGRNCDTPDIGPCARLVMMDVSALKTANDNLMHSLETFFRYWRP